LLRPLFKRLVFVLELITDANQRINTLFEAPELVLERRIFVVSHGNQYRHATGQNQSSMRRNRHRHGPGAPYVGSLRDATWDAAQAHGLLSSRLAVASAAAGPDWLQQVLEGTNESDALRTECAGLLNALYQGTHRQLSERLSEFAPLLPDDSDSAPSRAAALGHWCEGFLHGLVSIDHGEALKQRLAKEPLADIIRDMLQFEAAYAEIVEYVRVAAQLTYEELAEFRGQASAMPSEPKETLH
jgi:yecA family protein